MLWFALFRRYFFSSKSHSLIRITGRAALAGLTVSSAALILVLAVMDGFGRAVKTRLLSGEPHLVIRPFPPAPFPRRKEDVLALIKSQELKKAVQNISFAESQDLLLKTESGFAGVVAKGLPFADFLAKGRAADEAAGSHALPPPSPLQDALLQTNPSLEKPSSPARLIVNESLRAALGLREGDAVLAAPVAALLLPSTEAPPLKSARLWKTFVSHDGGGGAHDEESLSVFYEKGRLDFGFLSNIQPAWEIQLKEPETHHLYTSYFSAFKTETWAERNSSLLFALKMEKFIMILFISLAVLISCLGVSTALFMVTAQKAKDIGFLQAAGLSRRETALTFAKTGMALAVAGVSAGLILALLLIACIKYGGLNILPPMYYDRSPPVVFSLQQMVLVVTGSLAVAWPACLIPARRLSAVPPAELLKSVPR